MGLRKGCTVATRAMLGLLFLLLSSQGFAQTGSSIVHWAAFANGVAAAVGGPTITSFSPASGPPGTVVTINGTGFSATKSLNTVNFGGRTGPTATIQTATTTRLTVVAPSGATNGFFWVTVSGVQASSPSSYLYPPVINYTDPTSGAVGSTVTISGSNLTPTAHVTFGGGVVQNSIYSVLDQNNIVVMVPAGAQTGQITLTTNSGLISNASPSFTVIIPAPTITGINPTSGVVGTTVTITGTNFSPTAANNSVSFNGTAATVTAASTTSLTVTVPAGATSGAVAVTVNGMTATGPSFTVLLPDPTINGFSPSSGPWGTSVVISGTNFSSTPTNNQVYFTNVPNGAAAFATVTAATPTSLTVTVPNTAISGLFTVSVTGAVNSATSPLAFSVTVPVPTITGFSPSIGPVGTSVTITGTNFSATAANNVVKFNGTAAAVTAASATSLTATVPSGATSGKISVTVSSSQSGINSQTAT
ncbi:IPT/TIG domain-containing protein, partial [Rudaea cellulosilytica]|uniref:IPT/TIG domain-containing protein n=1 Tax=Rudaea cellulosilytica TaxID=540746 RepID=UPI001B7F83A6